ncbi:family 43 glycosylhydrolase [Treponema sp. R80B11-R83G3]
MKKRIIFSMVLVALVLLAVNCSSNSDESPSPPPTPENITVSFNGGYSGAQSIPSITVTSGTSAGAKWPSDPLRLGYSFDGWFNGATKYTSASVITGNNFTVTAQWSVEVPKIEDQPSAENLASLFSTADGFPANLSNSWKVWGHRNALITQGFGADPTAMAYNDRLYVFASNDSLMYNEAGQVIQMTYADGIQGVRAISSSDLSNWTDHGLINVGNIPTSTNPLYPMVPPVTSFETRSWAPCATWKTIGGKPKFFLYFANSGNGIGVISADSPTGPWKSPLPKLLIDRQTENCANVEYLFDPGVTVDENGQGIMVFGGGGSGEDPGNARRVRLSADMISLAGIPETWVVPFLFEASDITYMNDRYYYSYVTNSVSSKYNLQNTQIAYMTATEPFGVYSNPIGILNSPSSQLGSGDQNNHHCIFQFRDKTYIVYHASKVAQAMGFNMRFRSSFMDRVTVNASTGALSPVTMTRKGVDQDGYLNPYIPNEAETIGIQGGIFTRPDSGASNGMLVTAIDSGDWVALYGVDFGNVGANKLLVRVRTPDTPADYVGAIELRIDPIGDGVTSDTGNLDGTNTARIKNGTVVGRVQIKAKPGESGKYTSVTVDLDQPITGVHNLVFVFYSSLGANPITTTNMKASHHKNGFEFDQWQFLP